MATILFNDLTVTTWVAGPDDLWVWLARDDTHVAAFLAPRDAPPVDLLTLAEQALRVSLD